MGQSLHHAPRPPVRRQDPPPRAAPHHVARPAAAGLGLAIGSGVKLGIVSDLHCNIDGLDRALAIMGPIDALLCLGDSIDEYGFSNAVVGRLRALDALTILGNHEEVFLGPAGVRARARADIDRRSLDWLAGQPHRRALQIGGKRILMVHSTPWEPRGSYVQPHSSELERFGEADADIVLYGHTHRQVVRRIGRVLVVNPGSAGDARDPRNGRQLSCAVLDTVTEEATVHDFPVRASP
ncbi:MAG: metallophosphoesterase family protein [Alphaproteobacteria bacterium]|nr:metallophosphoesterase family protein [Alphaproteobacteria bacterium]